MRDEWLVAPLEGHRVRIERGDMGLVVKRNIDGEEVGTVVVEEQDDVLFVRALCVEEEHRGFGLGSETAHLVRKAAAAGFTALRAWAPPDRGLAVYFWCRMGLRPLHGDGPEGGIWLERRL